MQDAVVASVRDKAAAVLQGHDAEGPVQLREPRALSARARHELPLGGPSFEAQDAVVP